MKQINESEIPNGYIKYEDGLVKGLSDSMGELIGGTPPPGGGGQQEEKKPETHKERAIVPNKNQQGGGDSSSDDSLLPSDEKDNSQQQDDSQSGGSSSKSIDEMSADEAADSAQNSADKAQKSADSARQSAIGAQNAADKASENAEKAKVQFGEDSQEYKDMKDLADEAASAANDAQEAADSAQESADKAQSDANKAREAAKNGDTQSARDAAGSASENANDAKNAADDAKMNSWFAQDTAKESDGDSNGGGQKNVSDMSADEAADEAQKAAEDAWDAANDAQEAANDAQDIADKAKEAAEKAKRKYGEDSQEYQNAKSKADRAQQSADKAQEAADKANDAANDAQDAADSAKEASEKGDTDAARENAKKAQSENDKAQRSADRAVDEADNSADMNSSSDNGQQQASQQRSQQNSKNGDESSQENGEQSGQQGNQQDSQNGDESKANNGDSDTVIDKRSEKKQHGYSDGTDRKERNRDRKSKVLDYGGRINHSTERVNQRVVGEMIKQSDLNSRLGESLKRSGFGEDSIKDLMHDLSSRPIMGGDDIQKLRDDIVKSSPKSALGKLFTKLKMSQQTINDLWQEVVKKFLESNTLYANKKHKIPDRNKIRWGNRRTLAHDIIQPYHPKNDAAPQNINVFVDTSNSVDRNTVELFANTIVDCCDKLEYSGLTLMPFARSLDTGSSVYFKADEVKRDKDAAITKILNMVNSNNAGRTATKVDGCVEYALKNVQNDRFSVWIFLTDGEFNANPLKKLIPMKNKLLFVIYNYDIISQFNKYLGWCVNPEYEPLSRCYIELDENCKGRNNSPFYK